MKIPYVIVPALLTVALTLPVFGQTMHSDAMKSDMRKHDAHGMTGKPVVDVTVEGLHMKVWIVEQGARREMMQKKSGSMMKRDERDDRPMGRMEMTGMRDTRIATDTSRSIDRRPGRMMVDGTHHIMLTVVETAGAKETSDATARVVVESPSKTESSVELVQMTGHMGGSLMLDEKGSYRIAVSVHLNGVSRTEEFKYAVE